MPPSVTGLKTRVHIAIRLARLFIGLGQNGLAAPGGTSCGSLCRPLRCHAWSCRDALSSEAWDVRRSTCFLRTPHPAGPPLPREARVFRGQLLQGFQAQTAVDEVAGEPLAQLASARQATKRDPHGWCEGCRASLHGLQAAQRGRARCQRRDGCAPPAQVGHGVAGGLAHRQQRHSPHQRPRVRQNGRAAGLRLPERNA
jgi:hypothetical protein